MRIRNFIIGAGLATALAGCSTLSADQSIADYCAEADNQNEGICRLNVEIDGVEASLAETDLSVSEAQRIAAAAQASADNAQSIADQAMSLANRALTEDDLSCKTRVIQKTDTGTCEPGYSVMSCTQTRYTTRAGGLSFLREIDNESCRFNSRVLEMHVRCCTAGAPVEAEADAETGAES